MSAVDALQSARFWRDIKKSRANNSPIPPHTIVRCTGRIARDEQVRIGGEAYTVTADLGEWHAPDGRRGRITHLRRWDGVKSQHVLVEVCRDS
jgi:hypothetical protein